MARPFSLTAYQTWARRAFSATDSAAPPDLAGRLHVWVHAAPEHRRNAARDILTRVAAQRPGLVTRMVDLSELPSEHPAAADRYARHLAPDLALWASDALRPSLFDSFANQGTRLIALDLGEQTTHSPAPRWLPSPVPAALSRCSAVHGRDANADRWLRKIGMTPQQIGAAGVLRDSPLPPPCPIAQHEEMSALLATRPIWLAARITIPELHEVILAHRHAQRLAHRLLLIVVPDSPEHGRSIASALNDVSDMRVCHWDDGHMPDESTQILLTEEASDIGLWYRLAPMAFVGGTLAHGAKTHSPLEAASLGVAVLHGPHVGPHLDSYSRLRDAGGARLVQNGASLAEAVSDVLAPDKAAMMAHAGWMVASAGAQLADAVVDEICALLDLAEAS